MSELRQMPQPGQQDPGATGPDLFSVAQSAHQKVRAVYDKVDETKQQLTRVRGELDKLMNLGDMVSEDDVIGAAGRLVGHGLGAEAMAELLATMPMQGGQALAGWIATQDAQLKQHEFMVHHTQQGLRHELGQSAMRVLAAAQLHGGGEAQPIQSGAEALDVQQAPNPLAMGTA